jgi:hypothetical protein
MSPSPTPRPPLIFVSYDRQEVEVREVVLGLANRLRQDGVDARLDLYEPGPAEGWEHWRERQLLAADFVVVVCTASYRRHFEAYEAVTSGLQVRWEAGLLRRRLHDGPMFGARVLPVLLPGASVDMVPETLRGYTRYLLPAQYDDLFRRITGQPAVVGPPLGTLRRRIDNLGRRPPVFEGREHELERIRMVLQMSSTATTYTTLSGMGGIGKTRLALEHAYRGAHDYDLRWWLRAGDLASLHEDLAKLGRELGILSCPDCVEQCTREVLEWLSNHQRWLVVFDDVEGPTMILDLLPRPCRGHVLITSRARAWRSVAEVIEVKLLSSQAATTVLVRRSGVADDGYANAVAAGLGHLPLALVQAGAYIEATGCSFRGYLDRFEREGLALLRDPKSAPDGDHELTVARTWDVSLAAIQARKPAAAALLDWLVFLDPGGVPLRLLHEHVALLHPELAACVGVPIALDDAIAVLLEFGMIERDDDVLRVHNLVQAVAREYFRRTADPHMVGVDPSTAPIQVDVDNDARTSEFAVARELFRRDVELAHELVTANPHGDEEQQGLLCALVKLADLEVLAGNDAAVRELLPRLLHDDEALTRADPSLERAILDLALLYAEPSKAA